MMQKRITWYGTGEVSHAKEIDEHLAAGWRVVTLAGTGNQYGKYWTAIVEGPPSAEPSESDLDHLAFQIAGAVFPGSVKIAREAWKLGARPVRR